MKYLFALALVLASGSAFAGCPEGDVQHWPSASGASDGEGSPITVPWVCLGGRYVEMYGVPRAPEAPRTCKEGSIEYFPDYDDNSYGEGGPVNVPWICRNGGFVKLYNSTPVRKAKPVRCKEGQIEVFETGGGEGSPSVREVYICKNGQFRRVN